MNSSTAQDYTKETTTNYNDDIRNRRSIYLHIRGRTSIVAKCIEVLFINAIVGESINSNIKRYSLKLAVDK
jgi:hypothetical protein